MQKSWQTIKSEVINLGFEKSKVYDKNKIAFIEAFNWAQNFIAATVCPILDSIIILQSKSDAIYNRYDLENLTAQDGVNVYISLSEEKPIFSGDKQYEAVGDYRLENGKIILFKGSYDGEFRVFYKKYPKPITVETPDDYPVEIEYSYSNLLPYLMANRLWLDDDMAKAVSYWNLYEDMKNQIEQTARSSPVTAQVIYEGWDI